MISFRRGKTKVRIITEEHLPTPQNNSPLYAEGVHMLDGLSEEALNLGSDGNPQTLKFANNLPADEQSALILLVTEY